MPYNVRKRDGKWIVVDDKGHVYGRHSSAGKARRQQRALYANTGHKRGKNEYPI